MITSLVPLVAMLAAIAWLVPHVVKLGGDLAHGWKNPCLEVLSDATRLSLRIGAKGSSKGDGDSCYVQYERVRIDAQGPGQKREQLLADLKRDKSVVGSVAIGGLGDDLLVATTPKDDYSQRESLHLWRCGEHVGFHTWGTKEDPPVSVTDVAAAAAAQLDKLCVYGRR